MYKKNLSRAFGCTLLISGTSIGAAMLAMPILTGLFGFVGTIIILVFSWAIMYWMATLILEACLQFEEEVSFLTLARKVLGKTGALVTWVSFLLLFYSLVAAYLQGCGKIFIDFLEHLFDISLPEFVDLLPLLIVFSPFIYFGVKKVDIVNRFLMLGMLASYVFMVFGILPHMTLQNLAFFNLNFSLLSFAVVVTSFGYHVIIPSIVTYLDRDVPSIKLAIFLGSFIPLVIYIAWEAVILGSLSVFGDYGLYEAFKKDWPLAKILRGQLKQGDIALFAQGFSIFAIITSFMGVSQGLFDFIKDGIKNNSTHAKRLISYALTFTPPLLLIVLFRGSFIVLLEYAGALVSIVLGIIPILIVWRLRKTRQIIIYKAKGNAISFIFGILFFTFVVIVVIANNLNLLPQI